MLEKATEEPLSDRIDAGVHAELRRLWIQRVTTYILFLPFTYAFIFFMRFIMGYKMPGLKEARKKYKKIIRESKDPLIICANHFTYIDSPLMLWALGSMPWYFFRNYKKFSWNLPAGEYFKRNFGFRLVGFLGKCIFVHRDGTREHKNTILNLALHLIKKGHVVTLFPEATRSRSGEFEHTKLKRGIGKLLSALDGRGRVLCIYVRGDKQKIFSSLPPKGSTIYFDMELIQPTTDKKGREAYSEYTTQVGQTLHVMEKKFFQLHPLDRPWALVTGASSGIGRAFALRLARKGYHLALISRDRDRLEKFSSELREKYTTQIRIFAKDLAEPEVVNEIYESLQNEGIILNTLINNAGFGLHGRYLETDALQEQRMVMVHVMSMLQLTKLFLKDMVRVKNGKILNVASIYSFASVPEQSVYSATKAFMYTFTQALAHETRGTGITVTALCPGTTRTEFRLRMGLPIERAMKGMEPDKVVKAGLSALEAGKTVVVPGFWNRVFVFGAWILPRTVVLDAVEFISLVRGLKKATDQVKNPLEN